MSSPIQTSVVIIGGSIVGLTTSAFLAQRKVPHIMIEKHTGSSPHPRAVGYVLRTVELMRMLGIDDQIPQVGMGGKPRRVKVESLAGKWADETHWTGNGKPSGGDKQAAQKIADDLSPVGNAALSQDKIEPIIRKRAQDLGADHRLGYKMTSWSQDDSGVSVTAVSKEGEEIQVRAKYLIAADGGASGIRESLNISRNGVGHMRTLRSMLFRCEPIKRHLAKGFHQFSILNGAFEAFMTTYPDGRWALMTYDTSHSALNDAGQRDLIRRAAGEDIPDSEIELLAHGTWDLAAYIADSFRSGRVFLAGDAAHTLPPTRGGYGANTGIADGHDLAWKLAAVLSGESAPSLLDTYEAERRPIALVRHDQVFARADYKDYLATSTYTLPEGTQVLDDIAMELGQIYTSSSIITGVNADADANTPLPAAQTPSQWAGQPGTRAPHIWLKHQSWRDWMRGNANRISILDLFYKGWVVLSYDARWRNAGRNAARATGVAGDFVQIGVEAVEEDGEEGLFGRSFGVGRTGAVLVRPDGVIAWRCVEAPSDEGEVLIEVLSKVAHAARRR